MADDEKLSRAELLVGRFFRHFGAIELELNEAIRKLFELTPDSAETVCANIDFFRKVHIVRSALTDQDTDGKHKENIKGLFSRIAAANNHRLIAAHAGFEPNGDEGVSFHRVTATTGLKRSTVVWTEKDCAKLVSELMAIRQELHSVAQTIAPYHPRLDFSDPRNSMYLATL
jgi:hypothetical protein